MAITWALTVVVENFARKEVRVTGVRTGTAPDPVREDTYSTGGHVDSAPNKQEIMNRLRAKHNAKVGKETNLATVVADLVASGEAAMNQWEIDNG